MRLALIFVALLLNAQQTQRIDRLNVFSAMSDPGACHSGDVFFIGSSIKACRNDGSGVTRLRTDDNSPSTTIITGTITSDQILSMATAPAVLVGAQGPGTIIVPERLDMNLIVGTPYAAGSSLNVLIGSANTGFGALNAVIITSTTNEFQFAVPSSFQNVSANFINQPVSLKPAGAAFTTGTGTINFTLRYHVATSVQ